MDYVQRTHLNVSNKCETTYNGVCPHPFIRTSEIIKQLLILYLPVIETMACDPITTSL